MDRVRMDWETRARMSDPGEAERSLPPEERSRLSWRKLAWEVLDAMETHDPARAEKVVLAAAARMGWEPRQHWTVTG